MSGSANCLILTNIFPPIRGGSAAVYENMARYGDGRVLVLAPYRNYQNGRVSVGWLDYDKSQPFKVYRMELLRPLQENVITRFRSVLLFLLSDIPLRLKILRAVARIIKKEDIKIICVGELDSGSWIGPLARTFFGCKIVNFIHGEEITTQRRYRFFGRKKRRYLGRADAIVAVSNFTKAYLMDQMGVAGGKIELIYNGVELGRFKEQKKSKYLVDRYGLEGKKVILTVGRLIERKGIDTVIRSIPKLIPKIPDIYYLIIGDGPYRRVLEQLVQETGMTDRVTFAGLVDGDDLVRHYALCDVFVMPNRELPDGDTEGFGLVFLEANACGKPVVAGKAGGTSDAVQDGYNGLLVVGTDVGEIANAICRVFGDEALYSRLRAGGLEHAQKSDSRSRAQQFVRLCERLAG